MSGPCFRTIAVVLFQIFVHNDFGRHLLCICDRERFNLVILNGCLPGDEEGTYTYIAYNGSSVTDNFLLSGYFVHVGIRAAVILILNPSPQSARRAATLPVGDGGVCVGRQRGVTTHKQVGEAKKVRDY